jgi:hypothetical protein
MVPDASCATSRCDGTLRATATHVRIALSTAIAATRGESRWYCRTEASAFSSQHTSPAPGSISTTHSRSVPIRSTSTRCHRYCAGDHAPSWGDRVHWSRSTRGGSRSRDVSTARTAESTSQLHSKPHSSHRAASGCHRTSAMMRHVIALCLYRRVMGAARPVYTRLMHTRGCQRSPVGNTAERNRRRRRHDPPVDERRAARPRRALLGGVDRRPERARPTLSALRRPAPSSAGLTSRSPRWDRWRGRSAGPRPGLFNVATGWSVGVRPRAQH